MVGQCSVAPPSPCLRRLLSLLLFLAFLARPTMVPAQTESYALQVASFASRSAAEAMVADLRAKGLDAYSQRAEVSAGEIRYRVRIGGFATRSDAVFGGSRLRSAGVVEDFFVASAEPPLNQDATVTIEAPVSRATLSLASEAPAAVPAEAETGDGRQTDSECRPLVSFVSPRWIARCAPPPAPSSRARSAR